MKTYLVTGAFRGIGLDITKRLLKDENTQVVGIFNSSYEEAHKLAEQYGDRLLPVKTDLSNREELLKAIEELRQYNFDGIVNNAGVLAINNWDEELDLDGWDKSLQVNLIAPLMLVHDLRNQLNEGASVVNIASVDGYLAAYGTLAYAASKAALINLTKSLAALLGERKIRVNAIAPGWIETGMNIAGVPSEAMKLTPLGRNGTGEDIANVVAFLLSNQSGFVNGETITADGGLMVVDYTVWKEEQNF